MANHEDRKPVPPRTEQEMTKEMYERARARARAEELTDAEAKCIPVSVVQFDRALQFPGSSSATCATSRDHNNGTRLRVEYLPALQHFRLAFTDDNRPEKSGVGYVWIGRALSWEPAQ